MAILSWLFLGLIPAVFLGTFYITYKRLDGSKFTRMLLGLILGGLGGFIMFILSAFIGMNFY